MTDIFAIEVGTEIWDRFIAQLTPTHGIWLNRVGIEIGLLSRRRLGYRYTPGLTTLRRECQIRNRL